MLADWANRIQEQSFRKQFDNDPAGTLKQLDPEGVLDKEVHDFLIDLSYEELRTLARMQKTMVDAGLYVQAKEQMVSLGHL